MNFTSGISSRAINIATVIKIWQSSETRTPSLPLVSPLVILNCSRLLSMVAVFVGLLSEICVAQASEKTLASVQDMWMLH